jgi:hypothetical protein
MLQSRSNILNTMAGMLKRVERLYSLDQKVLQQEIQQKQFAEDKKNHDEVVLKHTRQANEDQTLMNMAYIVLGQHQTDADERNMRDMERDSTLRTRETELDTRETALHAREEKCQDREKECDGDRSNLELLEKTVNKKTQRMLANKKTQETTDPKTFQSAMNDNLQSALDNADDRFEVFAAKVGKVNTLLTEQVKKLTQDLQAALKKIKSFKPVSNTLVQKPVSGGECKEKRKALHNDSDTGRKKRRFELADSDDDATEAAAGPAPATEAAAGPAPAAEAAAGPAPAAEAAAGPVPAAAPAAALAVGPVPAAEPAAGGAPAAALAVGPVPAVEALLELASSGDMPTPETLLALGAAARAAARRAAGDAAAARAAVVGAPATEALHALTLARVL